MDIHSIDFLDGVATPPAPNLGTGEDYEATALCARHGGRMCLTPLGVDAMMHIQCVYTICDNERGAVLPRTGASAPAPVRGPAGLLRRGAPLGGGRPALRLHGRLLPGAVPQVPAGGAGRVLPRPPAGAPGPGEEGSRPERAAVADVRQFHLAPRQFATALGGLFVFVPWLVRLDLEGLVATAGLPGTRMIPAAQAVRATLALKLTSTERKSHVMDLVFDEGLALWTGLNVPPKTTFLSQYSSRLGPLRLAARLAGWIRTLRGPGVLPGQSF